MYDINKIGHNYNGGGLRWKRYKELRLHSQLSVHLNWGLSGLFQFDVVAELAGGSAEPVARLIYAIIGVSGLINLGLLFREWQGDRNCYAFRLQKPRKNLKNLSR